MGRVAILQIGYGSFEQGFEVSLEIKADQGQSLAEIAGKLPTNVDIENLYQSWQQSFYQLAGIYRHSTSWDVDNSIPTNVSNLDLVTDCQQKFQDLEANMKSWLQPSADSNWQRIRERFAQELASHAPEIRLIIKARDKILWKLPWHLWDLCSDYPDVGIGYSTNEYSAPILKQVTRERAKPASKADLVRILAVFGNSQDIDLTTDKQAIDSLKNTDPDFLPQPTATKLIQKLRDDEGWDIFFFAGHSHSNNDTGRIYINDRESLTIDQFRNALTEAISKGLKIAIFNSCDSLALAQALTDLHLPVVIVMQEIVPDIVAQSFLKEFLREYNSGKLLYSAVRKAQDRLEAFTQFPGAILLPLILQNPAVIPPRWDNFLHTSSEKLPTQSRDVISFQQVKPQYYFLRQIVFHSLVVSTIVLGIRWLGLLQPLELYAFDHLIQLQPKKEKPDPRILVVTIDEEDIKYQDSQNLKRVGSLSDQSLSLALDELETLNPTTIALDIYRPNGFTSEVVDRIKNDNRFFAICKIQEFNNNKYSGGVEPPSNLPQERLVFSDIPVDKYKIVRRQFLDMTSLNASDPCNTQYSLSFLVAQHYLYQQHNITATHTTKQEWQLGNVVFPKLKNHSSGYHQLDDSGYQILLNYRRGNSLQQVAHSISLTELIEQGISPSLKDRIHKPIILIGTTEESYEDYHPTPYGKEIPGVFLQAQMTSQILSAVLDNRPLLWYWNTWIEAIWIGSWSIMGGFLALSISQLWRLFLNLIGIIIGITGIGFVVLTYSGWIPIVPAMLGLLIMTILVKNKLINKYK